MREDRRYAADKRAKARVGGAFVDRQRGVDQKLGDSHRELGRQPLQDGAKQRGRLRIPTELVRVVIDNQPAAGSNLIVQALDRSLRRWRVLDHADANDDIELPSGKGEREDVGLA